MESPRHSAKRSSLYSTPSIGRAFLRMTVMPYLVSNRVLSKSNRYSL